jgi:hypothetical protein
VLSKDSFTTIDFLGATFTNALGINRGGKSVGTVLHSLAVSS